MRVNAALLLVLVSINFGIGGCRLIRAIQDSQKSPEPDVSPIVNPSPSPSQTIAPSSPIPDDTRDATTPKATGQAAVLANLPAGSRIDIFAQSNFQSAVVHSGVVGDRVHVQAQSPDQNGKLWYYVTFDDTNTRGWVQGNLVRYLNTPAAPANTTISFETALNRCRSQAQVEFPGARIDVSQGWRKPDGSFVVNWQTSTGASGTCTVDTRGWVTAFVNSYTDDRPSNPGITPVALQSCKNRVANVQGLPLADVTVKAAAAYADGTFGVNWWTQQGNSGFCRVNRNGEILSFTTNNRPNPEQVALKRCKQRAERAIPGAQIRVYRDQRDRSALLNISWTASTGEEGYCRVDRNGRLVEFVTNPDPPRSALRCVGNVGEIKFAALSGDRRFYRADVHNVQTGYRFSTNLNGAGVNDQGQPVYRGQNPNPPFDQVTVVDLANGNPSPGSEISFAYNGNWQRGRCHPGN